MMYKISVNPENLVKSCLQLSRQRKINQDAPFYLPAMLIFPENLVCELKKLRGFC